MVLHKVNACRDHVFMVYWVPMYSVSAVSVISGLRPINLANLLGVNGLRLCGGVLLSPVRGALMRTNSAVASLTARRQRVG